MGKITEQSIFDEEIYLLEEQDPLLGGANGELNKATISLSNRTSWLKKLLQNLIEAGGLTFERSQTNQLKQAILNIISTRTYNKDEVFTKDETYSRAHIESMLRTYRHHEYSKQRIKIFNHILWSKEQALSYGFLIMNEHRYDLTSSDFSTTQKKTIDILIASAGWQIARAGAGNYIKDTTLITANWNKYFMRVDSARSLGSLQEDQFKSHSHGISTYAGDIGNGVKNGGTERGTWTIQSSSAGGDETRPKNLNAGHYYYFYIGF